MPDNDGCRHPDCDYKRIRKQRVADTLDFHANHPEGYGIDVEPAQPVDPADLDYYRTQSNAARDRHRARVDASRAIYLSDLAAISEAIQQAHTT
jgi:hypothetical protein